MCRPPVSCAGLQTRYRTFDGTCNNIERPSMGAADQCNKRLLPASYRDGISEPPVRPNVASIYEAVQDIPVKDMNPIGRPTAIFAEVFQFFAHDVSATALSALQGELDCCSRKKEPQCALSIDVTPAREYREKGAHCLPFLRAARCPCSGDSVRQSLNTASAYIDLSQVYGKGERIDRKRPWLLSHSITPDHHMLPLRSSPAQEFASNVCLQGDMRASQQQSVSFFTIVFLRQHNLIAGRLRAMNKKWSVREVFEEARRIVIARWQIVYFAEALNLLVDKDLPQRFKLHMDDLSAGTEYNPSLESGILAEYIFAESRGHGLVPATLGTEEFKWFDSSEFFADNSSTYISSLARILWGTEANRNIPYARSVAHELFKGPRDSVGLSMLMYNIQRGRDVGLPDYRRVLEWAHNATIESFDDIRQLNVSSEETVQLLERLYQNINEIDLFVGASLEKPYGTGVIQLTNQMMKLHQHVRQVYGDRFFWSHRGVLTDAQRKVLIASSTLSQLLCEVLDIEEVPEDVMTFQGDRPAMKLCSSYGNIDLDPWKNE